jgi:hypothetical protein
VVAKSNSKGARNEDKWYDNGKNFGLALLHLAAKIVLYSVVQDKRKMRSQSNEPCYIDDGSDMKNKRNNNK